MGINGLWEIIGNGEIWSIADYAARHFEQHKRPLRIAVDEACWRFTNLTPEQVQKIREGELAANPVEKVVLWRILRLLKLNMQLIFVNDGMRKPWKRNKRGGKLDYELMRLTHQLLDKLKVPYHLAPGEAEAECARMQALGIVDAVWSDDGDSLMFGCGTLIRQHKEAGKIVKDHIRVYNADTVLRTHDLDSESLVMFAVLAGGDYSTDGLRGCGPKSAALLARRSNSLARDLCHATQNDIPMWRQSLLEVMDRYDKRVEVPWTFPDFKALGHYCSPVVSSPEQIHNLRDLKNGWDQKIDQPRLRIMLRERFNFTTREFMKHITPIFLTRDLARATPEQREENLTFDIELKKTRQKKSTDDEVPAKSEVKILFSPLSITEVDLSERPPEKDWSKFDGKNGMAYDSTQKVECEVLSTFLRHGLPDGIYDALVKSNNKPVKRKRKADDDDDCDKGSSQPKQRKRAPAAKHRSTDNDQSSQVDRIHASTQSSDRLSSSAPYDNDDAPANSSAAVAAKHVQKRGGRPPKEVGADAAAKKRKKKTVADASMADDPNMTLTSPEIPTFRYPRPIPPLPQRNATVVDLYDDESDDERESIHPSSSNGHSVHVMRPSNISKAPLNTTSANTLVPGETISPEALRTLRAGSRLLQQPVEESLFIPELPQSLATPRPGFAKHEVIDLTWTAAL